ncbi:MAG: undecaprenyl-diphosphate phosphatase [Lentisphaeria bacterium]|nr:undecaprenyl-diphosphate phosphatase [Lentisphaeria bacterium]
MDLYWKAALQGIVQGVTEFLPVSSTGHLILVGKFMDFGGGSFTNLFNVVIQFASILAVVLYFHKTLIPAAMLKDAEIRMNTFRIWLKIIAGVMPILVIGFLSADLVEKMQDSPLVVAIALLIGGILLLKVEEWCRREKTVDNFQDLSYKTAVGIGLIQCLAMIPGTSRSASTIIGALALGASRPLAAEFSFLLAIPTMAAASGYSLLKHGSEITTQQAIALSIGFVFSFLVSWGVIAWLMNFIRTRDFKVFGWYRIALGIVVLGYIFFLHQ